MQGRDIASVGVRRKNHGIPIVAHWPASPGRQSMIVWFVERDSVHGLTL